MKISNEVYCSSCRKRLAVYKRIVSGEKLCRYCLYNSVVKQVRKAVHYYKMVRKNGSAIYILRPERILSSIEGLYILISALKDFNVALHVLCIYDFIDCETLSKLFPSVTFINIRVGDKEFKSIQLIELIKFYEVVAIKIAREKFIESILVPLFRDELSILLLYGLLMISKSIFSEGMPIRIVDDNISLSRPFYYVTSIDIIYLSLTDKKIPLKTEEKEDTLYSFIKEREFWRKAKDILIRSPELMYSSSKTVELLQSYVIGSKATRCKYCGSYSDSDLCEICSRILGYIDAVEYGT